MAAEVALDFIGIAPPSNLGESKRGEGARIKNKKQLDKVDVRWREDYNHKSRLMTWRVQHMCQRLSNFEREC